MVRLPVIAIELIWIIISFRVSGVKVSTFFSSVQPPANWQSAHAHCRNNFNGSLLIKGDPLTLLDHVTSVAIVEDVWTSTYLGLSPWIIYKGCFDSTHINSPQFYKLSTNESTIGSCFRSCSELNTPYFGLQGKSCICLPTMLQAKIDDGQCKSSCGGKCGGHDSITVYKKYFPSEKDDHESRQCATVTCHQDGKHVYRAHRCSNRFNTLCSSGEISSEKQSLRNGTQFCGQNKSRVVMDDVDDVCKMAAVDNVTQYWVDLRRYLTGPLQASFNDTDVYPFSCFKYSNKSYMKASSCKELNSYVCVVELTDENADSLCSSKLKEAKGFTIENSGVVDVTIGALCEQIRPSPVNVMNMSYSGVIGLAVSGSLVLLGFCIVSILCCGKRKKKSKEKPHTEMKTVQYSPVKKNENV